jgi:hypothetical protein
VRALSLYLGPCKLGNQSRYDGKREPLGPSTGALDREEMFLGWFTARMYYSRYSVIIRVAMQSTVCARKSIQLVTKVLFYYDKKNEKKPL